ncbi:MFS transporter [Novosphingobium sp. MBES04]|uniref:MFS transporter n=1 Tax=Novosphingobium sp. MBES04 TaxID=1206458 RepID=UPI0007234FBA|nr:MFS transporter [Novosphingobium sp. MBES04]GAM06127.1 major facilitator superfamily protein [Novosphingobium sp. MBES04]
MPRNAQVMIAASLAFFFVTATTFTSLGYVLYIMVDQLDWSAAAAGFSFALLGLACGLASPLPPYLMKTIGTRLTMVLGALVLAGGFAMASVINDLNFFFVATSLMGAGFTLLAPSPAVYLLANWFPRTSSRMIGFYFMVGSSGGIAGPLIVSAIAGATGDWRLHWMVMAVAAAVLGLICFVCIRDTEAVATTAQTQEDTEASGTIADSGYTVRQALLTRTFLILAVILTVVQTVVTATHSLLVAHIANLGHGAAPGAIAMSLLAFAGTGTKGVTGAICERVSPRLILIGGLVLQALAMALLSYAPGVAIAIAAAIVFGAGWGMAWLSGHILLLRYFGARLAGTMTAMVTTASTLAVFGPIGAGRVADVTGTYAPAIVVFSGLLLAAAIIALLFLKAPRPLGAAQSEDTPDAPALKLEPAE